MITNRCRLILSSNHLLKQIKFRSSTNQNARVTIQEVKSAMILIFLSNRLPNKKRLKITRKYFRGPNQLQNRQLISHLLKRDLSNLASLKNDEN